MTRRQATAGPERTDRVALAHEHLVHAVEELTTGQAWAHMLDVARHFPTYSANNVLLIGIQRQDATRVAGIRTWNSLGRHVRKGEKGIAILAPCLYRPKPETIEALAKTQPGSEPPVGSPAARQLRGFRVVHVFDVLQTEGQALPDLGPAELTGPTPENLLNRVENLIRAGGFGVERGQCGTAYGYTDFAARTVRVRDTVADSQACKTLSHELGHIRADHETRFLGRYATSLECRAQAEVEAESISYLILGAAGMTTDAYAVPYLAGWSGGNTDLLREAAGRVITVARDAIRDLDLLPAGTGPTLAPTADHTPPTRHTPGRNGRDPLSA